MKRVVAKKDKQDAPSFDVEGGGEMSADDSNSHPFSVSLGLSSDESDQLLLLHGHNELPEKHIPRWYIFLSLLCEPMPVMIWIAAIIEAIIGKYMDMGILLGIQATNASIAFYETTQSGNAVAALKVWISYLAFLLFLLRPLIMPYYITFTRSSNIDKL